MFFIPLPQLSERDKVTLLKIHSKCKRTLFYENKNIARSVNFFIDSPEDQNWIYNRLIRPLGLPWNQIKNNHEESRCCGINFNVFSPGDWSYPHCDLNPTKIHFLLQGSKKHALRWPADGNSKKMGGGGAEPVSPAAAGIASTHRSAPRDSRRCEDDISSGKDRRCKTDEQGGNDGVSEKDEIHGNNEVRGTNKPREDGEGNEKFALKKQEFSNQTGISGGTSINGTVYDYPFPAVVDVSKPHLVTRMEELASPRIMLQVFLIEKIEYYAKLLKKISSSKEPVDEKGSESVVRDGIFKVKRGEGL